MSTSKWVCRFPGCDHEYTTDDYFGEAIPFLNPETGEILGWQHNGDDHNTPISPEWIIHYGTAHKPDPVSQQQRYEKLLNDTMAVHYEYFPDQKPTT